MRPLMARWNKARFDKADRGRDLTVSSVRPQLLDATSANLISTHTECEPAGPGKDLEDVPPTFFVDIDAWAGRSGSRSSAAAAASWRRRATRH